MCSGAFCENEARKSGDVDLSGLLEAQSSCAVLERTYTT